MQAPTLVLHVKGDLVSPIASGRELAAGIPGARFVEFEGQNHIFRPYDPAAIGFFDEIARNSNFTPGVYSSAPVWTSIFGTGGFSHIRHTFEWTYLGDTSSLSHTPDGWCLRNTSTCAQFYGGVTSSDSNAVMWQWSGGGGTFNGFGDFDQIDANRTPAAKHTPA